MLLLLFPVLSGGCPAVPRTLLQEKHSTPCGKMCVSRPKCMVLGCEMHPCAVSRRERREGQGFILLGIALHELLRLGAGNGLAAGQDYGTRHTHKTHEELYFILKGEGIFDVDGKRFPVSEGSIVRIAPNGKRAFKNTGSSEMLVLCVQYKANSFSDDDEPLKDGIMLEANVKL